MRAAWAHHRPGHGDDARPLTFAGVAFGRGAGLLALAVALGVLGTLLTLLQPRGVPATLPAMMPLGR